MEQINYKTLRQGDLLTYPKKGQIIKVRYNGKVKKFKNKKL